MESECSGSAPVKQQCMWIYFMYTCKTDQSSEGGKCEELTYTWVQLQLLHLHCLKSGLSETPLRGKKNGNFVASKPVKTLTHSQKKHKTTVCSV